MIGAIRSFIAGWLSANGGRSSSRSENLSHIGVEPVFPRVLLIVYNPVIHSEGGRKLSEVFQWNDPHRLVTGLIEDLTHASYGYCNYQIAERIEVDEFPVKADGFQYSEDTYLKAWRSQAGFHKPDWVDYDLILAQYSLLEKVNEGEIDEVWLMGFPYAGFYESRMVGPGAFWCNAPPLREYQSTGRRTVIMGFNYERGVGEMLESYGHRAESIMTRVFRNKQGESNLWERFIRHEKTHPGRAEVGSVHFSPNSRRDYDWGNRSKVMSRCDAWYHFPDLSRPAKRVESSEWGRGDTRLHHLWWFRHFPHVNGSSGGISFNWWAYVVDPNLVD